MRAYSYLIDLQLTGILARVLLILIFCGYTEIALSQYLKGRVYENNTHISLGSIRIKVSTATETILTDKNGNFKMQAKINDLLIISGFGYKTDTLLLTDMSFHEIYLMPQEHILKEVKIDANSIGSVGSFNFYDPDFHNQTVAKQFDDKGNYKGGVIFRFWYWKKDERKRKKKEQLLKTDSVSRKIDKVFCRDTVLKYLPLKSGEVSGFILRYSPGIEEFSSPEFNLPRYLSKCYREYKELLLNDRTKSPTFP
ncbi:hypothetical protein SAMN05428975_4921 [Mucilaginibacter sp. OK268]|uniref:hypothetical protein n=1 Tax=Mucilaginibacter sp. OK268 TaxID=1881048 RepID=UPI00088DC0E9|nr:hypothetical protein [Mucilaginibacter sp. OK268]SDP99140.1 hypothetical protein SAMN05428975_4921 [Mucilaginibacter sp. OK268]